MTAHRPPPTSAPSPSLSNQSIIAATASSAKLTMPADGVATFASECRRALVEFGDMTPVVLSELTGHLAEVAPGLTEQAGRLFHDNGFAKVGFLAPSSVTGAVRREAELLVTAPGARRDLRFAETGHTARRMRNVRRREIHQHGRVIPALYGQAVLRHALEPIVGEEVLPCPYEPEQYVITELTAQGDTHGWHWDDYSFALVWVLESPPAEDGGFVQFVPNTVWDKTNPRLHRQFIDHPIHSVELAAGDWIWPTFRDRVGPVVMR
jgi:hypothetical protein